MKHHFKQITCSGYLDSIQSDLEVRLDVLKYKLPNTETPEERAETLKNHIKLLELTKQWMSQIITDHLKLLDEKRTDIRPKDI